MKKHVIAITYIPKIEAVFDGRCRQTIRKGRRFKVGDEVLLHDWSGKPYRSKWDHRMRVTLREVKDLLVTEYSIGCFKGETYKMRGWKTHYCDVLAYMDYIVPPTGQALRDVLFGYNGIPKQTEKYQIIRW